MKCLPRLRWTIGQTLLPEHMRSLEESLLADSAVRGSLTGVPIHGFSDLRFGNSLRSDGLLTLQSATIVMKSGRLLSIGNNAVINSLNLNTSSGKQVRVFVHLLHPDSRSENSARNEWINEDNIPTWWWRLKLSLDENIQDTLEYLTLGIFDKDILSEWCLSSSYIPPLIKIGSEGFIKPELEELNINLDKYIRILSEEMTDIQLAGENLLLARICLTELKLFRQFVRNTLAEIHIHPYFFYERLQKFYLFLCSYQNVEPVHSDKIYRHDGLAECLLDILLATIGQLSRQRNVTPMTEFKLSSGTHLVTLSDAALNSQSWFLLVQKPNIQVNLDMESVKLAALPRLGLVHKHFLQAITLTRIDRPVFSNYFGPEVDVYKIHPGEEWNRAVNERSLAFIDEARFAGSKFYLYWSQT